MVTTGLTLRLFDARFAFWGDNAESFAPLWHHFGTAIRHGEWTLFDPAAWAGGNYVGEAAYGVFNPVSIANFVFLSFFDDLAVGTFLVMTEYLALLGTAVFLLARSYGALRAPSIAVGVALPFGGFTLFYGAGNWATGLISLTWVTWFWWSARRYSHGGGNPLPAFLFGALAITVGNPYAILGVLAALIALGAQLLAEKQYRTLLGLAAVGACVGAVVMLVYLPLTYALPATAREQGTAIVTNDSYLTPDLHDLLAASSPTYQPSMDAWQGRVDVVPSTYLAWFVIPLLPWIRWHRATRAWRTLIAPLAFCVMMLLMTVGPSHIWLFRWPLRLVEYLWVGVGVILATMLSHGVGRSHRAARSVLSACAVTFGFYSAWSVVPDQWLRHLAATLVVGLLLAAALFAWQRRGIGPACAVLVLGVAMIAPIQVKLYSWNNIEVGVSSDLPTARNLSTIRHRTQMYQGRVLQLADKRQLARQDALPDGRLNFGNTAFAAGQDTLNHYTGIGHLMFMSDLCLDYQTSVRCAEGYSVVHEPLSPKYSQTFLDAAGVDTLVYAVATVPGDNQVVPDGWHVAFRDEYRLVIIRDRLTATPVVTPSTGVRVANSRQNGTTVHFTATSSNDGTVLLDRLAWPGYTARTADGTLLAITQGPAGLIEIDVPPGTSEVTLTYAVPGLRTGALVAALAAIAMVSYGIASALHRRRTRPPHAIVESSSATM